MNSDSDPLQDSISRLYSDTSSKMLYLKFLKKNILFDASSLSKNELEELQDCFSNKDVAYFVKSSEKVEGENCWDSDSTSSTLCLKWLLNKKKHDKDKSQKISEDSFLKQFDKDIEDSYYFSDSGDITEESRHLINVRILFLKDTLSKELFHEFWNDTCLGNFGKLADYLFDIACVDNLLKIDEEKEEWSGVPLHLSLSLLGNE